jgi:hypothetical protein
MIKIVCQFDEQLDLIKKLIGVGGWLDVLLDVPVLHKQNAGEHMCNESLMNDVTGRLILI